MFIITSDKFSVFAIRYFFFLSLFTFYLPHKVVFNAKTSRRVKPTFSEKKKFFFHSSYVFLAWSLKEKCLKIEENIFYFAISISFKSLWIEFKLRIEFYFRVFLFSLFLFKSESKCLSRGIFVRGKFNRIFLFLLLCGLGKKTFSENKAEGTRVISAH